MENSKNCRPGGRRYFGGLQRKLGTAPHGDTGFVSWDDAEEAVGATGDYLAAIGADIDPRKAKA